MGEVGTAALAIIPSFKGFGAHLEKGVTPALTGAGLAGGRAYGSAAGRSVGASFAAAARRGLLTAGAGLTLAAAGAIKIGKDAYAEAIDAQKVGKLTTAVIKSTGGAANTSAKQVGDLSERLSMMAGIDDEVIQTSANLLLTFKNVRNELGAGNKVFDLATKAALNLSAAGFGSTDSAAKMLGKTLNDPVKGITALSRAGVTFTEGQKEKIASLVDENDLLGAQKIILGEVESQVGGAARSQATLGEKVGVAWGNIQEKLGTALLPSIRDAQRALLRDGVPAIEGWVDAFENKGIPAIKGFIDEARPLAREVGPAVATVLGDVRDAAKEAAPYVKDLVGFFNDMPDWAQKGLVGGGLGFAALGKLKGGNPLGGGKGGLLGGIASKASPLPVFVVNNGVDLPGGGGKPGTAGKLSRLATYGPLAIPAAGALGTAAVTPNDQLQSAAAASQGGMVAPSTRTDDLADPFSGFRRAYDELIGSTYKVPMELDFGESSPEDLKRLLNPANYPDSRKIVEPLNSGLKNVSDMTGNVHRQLRQTGAEQVAPKFSTPGADEARRKAVNLLATYEAAGRPVNTPVRADISAATATLNAWLANARRQSVNIHIGAGGAGKAEGAGSLPASDGGPPAPRGPGAGRGRVVLQIGDREIDAIIDERIDARYELTGQGRQ